MFYYFLYVGSLPTARSTFQYGSPPPVVLPPRLEAKTVWVVKLVCRREFEEECLHTL